MIAIHKSLRREFRLLPGLVSAVQPGHASRARVLAEHAQMEMTQLHEHHAAEDVVLWPELLRTGRVDAALIASMERQHEALADQITVVAALTRRWAQDAAPADRDALAVALSSLAELLDAHLDAEETEVLPLVRAYLTDADWTALRAESGRRVPKDPRVAMRLVGGLLEDADAHERQTLLDQMPAPVRWYVTTLGAQAYRRYVARIRPTP